MKLEKAIENLSDSANQGVMTFNQEHKDAEKLGIEAIKAITDYRQGLVVDFLLPLRGETDE